MNKKNEHKDVFVYYEKIEKKNVEVVASYGLSHFLFIFLCSSHTFSTHSWINLIARYFIFCFSEANDDNCDSFHI